MKLITKSEIINLIWNNNINKYKKKDIEFIVNSFVEVVGDEIKKGNKVKIDSFGTFSSFSKQSYVGKNINTGKIETINGTECISFKPSKLLKTKN